MQIVTEPIIGFDKREGREYLASAHIEIRMKRSEIPEGLTQILSRFKNAITQRKRLSVDLENSEASMAPVKEHHRMKTAITYLHFGSTRAIQCVCCTRMETLRRF